MHGIKPVPIERARSGLTFPTEPAAIPTPARKPQLPRHAAGLREWLRATPNDALSRVSVCSLHGGVGRSTVAALTATLIAETRSCAIVDMGGAYSPIPAMLGDQEQPLARGLAPLAGRKLSSAVRVSRDGTVQWAAAMTALDALQRTVNTLVVDWPTFHPPFSTGPVIVVTRSDVDALSALASHLATNQVDPARLAVVINHGPYATYSSRARQLATTIEGRCSGVAHLPRLAKLSTRPLAPLPKSAMVPVLRSVLSTTTSTQPKENH